MSSVEANKPKQASKVQRTVAKVVDALMQPVGTAGHAIRLVLGPGHWEEYDPFLRLAEEWYAPGTFDEHPHRGIETVTLVLDGQLRHVDSHGGRGVLGPGDAQWVTAGRGIVHREEPDGPRVHTLRLWINLPAEKKLSPPRSQDLRHADMRVRREPGARLRVFSGVSDDVAAQTRNHVPITMIDIRLDAGSSVIQKLPARHNAFLYMVEGSGRFGRESTAAKAAQVVWFSRVETDAASEIVLSADAPMRAVLWAGPPIREPVAARGALVMNSEEEIEEALADYRAGRF